jgi:signal transduction histidine kinase
MRSTRGGSRGAAVQPRKEVSRPMESSELALSAADVDPEKEALLKHLSEAVQLRDDFLSVASHELRTPIAVLKLRLETVLRQAKKMGPETEKLTGGIEIAIRQTARLSRLIDELLDVSRIASGHLKIERDDVDLSRVVGDVLARLRDLVERGGCAVESLVEPGVSGRWDRLRLEQVLVNLVTNAVKYGGTGRIDVSLSADEERATLRVRDHGPGIPPEQQARIFNRFVRAAPGEAGGLGLGLYIAREIIEGHGGTIHVDSRPGAGASFVVELPRR